jgi:hypothetical protein
MSLQVVACMHCQSGEHIGGCSCAAAYTTHDSRAADLLSVARIFVTASGLLQGLQVARAILELTAATLGGSALAIAVLDLLSWTKSIVCKYVCVVLE